MPRFPRTFIKHEVPRPPSSDGMRSIYCRKCGREVIRQHRATIGSISECMICTLKAQGVENAEELVLTHYMLSTDINRVPIPIDLEDGFEQGVLMLYPEEQMEQTGRIPMAGGVVGTVRAIFRALGFTKTKEEKKAEETVSKVVAKRKRSTGLYGE